MLPGNTAVVADPPPRGETVAHGARWQAEGPTLSFEAIQGDPAPSRGRHETVARFLRDQGVRVLLVQYLDLADRWDELLERLRIPV